MVDAMRGYHFIGAMCAVWVMSGCAGVLHADAADEPRVPDIGRTEALPGAPDGDLLATVDAQAGREGPGAMNYDTLGGAPMFFRALQTTELTLATNLGADWRQRFFPEERSRQEFWFRSKTFRASDAQNIAASYKVALLAGPGPSSTPFRYDGSEPVNLRQSVSPARITLLASPPSTIQYQTTFVSKVLAVVEVEGEERGNCVRFTLSIPFHHRTTRAVVSAPNGPVAIDVGIVRERVVLTATGRHLVKLRDDDPEDLWRSACAATDAEEPVTVSIANTREDGASVVDWALSREEGREAEGWLAVVVRPMWASATGTYDPAAVTNTPQLDDFSYEGPSGNLYIDDIEADIE